jgi:serine/threonine protein kinase
LEKALPKEFSDAIPLLISLLQLDFRKRPTCQEILKHSYLSTKPTDPSLISPINLPELHSQKQKKRVMPTRKSKIKRPPLIFPPDIKKIIDIHLNENHENKFNCGLDHGETKEDTHKLSQMLNGCPTTPQLSPILSL